jgi:hypothetical protein
MLAGLLTAPSHPTAYFQSEVVGEAVALLVRRARAAQRKDGAKIMLSDFLNRKYQVLSFVYRQNNGEGNTVGMPGEEQECRIFWGSLPFFLGRGFLLYVWVVRMEGPSASRRNPRRVGKNRQSCTRLPSTAQRNRI